MIDRRPAAIAYCVSERDVAAAIEYARREELRIAIRSGGHNGGGLGSVDDGIVIDLSEMNGITVDAAARIVRVQGGALLSELDTATHEHGLAVPIGIIGTTGVGGLTLGGGTGHLTRAAGLTIDHLIAATVVFADGSIVETDAEREPDLFWAIRGGGGNFGVVTSFSFTCVPVANVVAGPMFWPIERAEEILSWYRGFIGEQPTELGGFFNFHSVPPVDMFPEQYHLDHVCGVVWCCTDLENANELLAPARALAPIIDGVAEVPLPAMNTAFDGLYSPRRPVVLARRLPRRGVRRGRGGQRRVGTEDADVEVGHAYVSGRRGGVAGRQRRDRVGLPRREVGSRSSSASTPSPPAPGFCATGRSATPRRSIHIRSAAPT